MPNPLPFFPFYVNDWVTSLKVQAMQPGERALYLECFILQWREGYVPEDFAVLARATSWNIRTIRRLWPAVESALTRCEDGFLRSSKLSEVRMKRVSSKIKPLECTQAHVSANASDSVSVSDSVSDSVSEVVLEEETTVTETVSPREPKPDVAERTRWFDQEFWVKGVVWQKIASGAARTAWLKCVHTRAQADALIAAAIAQGPSILQHAHAHSHSVLHPSTWINQGRYDDEPALSLGLVPNGHPRPPDRESFEERHKRLRNEEFIRRMSTHAVQPN